MSTEAFTESEGAPTAESVADFLRRMRLGIEDGLDPRTAARLLTWHSVWPTSPGATG